MSSDSSSSHKTFYTTSSIFIALNAVGMICELGFNGIVARLPIGDYGVYGRLFSVFFIITVPLMSIQLMVSKEVSSLYATGKKGQAKFLIKHSLKWITITGLSITIIGLLASRLIADMLSIENVVHVILLMFIILLYIPFPVLIGTNQGLKRFYYIGFIAIVWGISRLIFGISVMSFGWGLNGILVGMIAAILFTDIFTFLPMMKIFKNPEEKLSKSELKRAYSFIVPIAVTLFLVTVLRSIDLVVAGHFFEDAVLDAYTCSARTGQAFFMLTGIFMVMFPLVSAENSLNRNPIIYLAKSLIVVILLSLGGIAVSWFAPNFVMNVITVGKHIEGAESLIKIVGLVILPVSIIYITANYYLAQHKASFIPILVGGMILQFVFILLFHETPYQMLSWVGRANYITLACVIVYLILDQRKYYRSLSN